MSQSASTAREATDLFIAHASEDKEAVVRPLADILMSLGWKIWLDELDLTLGDSLSSRIDTALAKTRFGVVILSPAFFAKDWPQRELSGLAAREIASRAKVILPVWHETDYEFIVQRSPVLADRLGVNSAGLDKVADEISRALEKSEAFPTQVSSTSPREAVRANRGRGSNAALDPV